jgi:hypothetical protein
MISAVCALLLAPLLHHDEPAQPSATQAPERFTTSRTSAIDLPLPEEKDAFVFCVYGDRTGGPAEGIEVLAQAVQETNLIAPDLVMTVGDLVQGYNDAPQWLKQMEEFKRTMNALGSPWFPVAGNHDVYWRGKGERPKGGNGALFEANFAPLWYAFEHKNSWFIALYSDEGDPATGEQAFDKPNCQRMSDAQFEWLASALARAKGAEHVFLFLHHPRWLRGGYGDDWERVHGLLKSAGNVSAVFAGHIHHMRYDGQRDGIEYFALATVGGDQSGIAAAAGYLHEFHVVTVRKDRVSLATLPVGTVMDPREITGQVSDEVAQLSRALPTQLAHGLTFAADESASGQVRIELANPTKRSVDVLLEGESDDARWSFTPDHQHAKLGAGESRAFTFDVARPAHAVDASLRLPELVLRAEYRAKGLRVPLPERRLAIPLDTRAVALPAVDPRTERVLVLDGENDALSIPARVLAVPDGPFTVEGWMRATKAFKKREGFICKTESSEFGIFVGEGIPGFSVHLGGKYANATAPAPILPLETWCHVAGVFDGAELRLYVDGKRVATQPASGVRRTNELPLYIGADVTSSSAPSSFFEGEIDEVRVSRGARYTGERFTPERRHASDADTLLLLHMDGEWGPWSPDASGAGRHALKVGHPRSN